MYPNGLASHGGWSLVFPTFQCQPNAGQQFLLGDRFAEETYCAGAQCLRAGTVIGKGSNYNNGDAITGKRSDCSEVRARTYHPVDVGVIRHDVSPSRSDCRNSSADENTSALKPNATTRSPYRLTN